MAIATMADLYNNPQVFTGVVKIRKGLALRLMKGVDTLEGLHKWFNFMAAKILKAVTSEDPNAAATRRICQEILALTESKAKSSELKTKVQSVTYALPILLTLCLSHLLSQTICYGLAVFLCSLFAFTVLSAAM